MSTSAAEDLRSQRRGPVLVRTLAVWLVLVANVVLTVRITMASFSPGRPTQGGAVVGDVVAVLAELSFVGVGALLALKQPGNVVAWLLLAVGSLWAVMRGLAPDLPGAWVPPVGVMGTQLLLRFPDGRLPSPKWRWFSWATIALIVVLTVVVTTASTTSDSNGPNPYFVAWTQPAAVLIVLLPLSILASASSLVVRYRRADLVEREQIRWIAWAAAAVAVLYALTLAPSVVVDGQGSASSGRLLNALLTAEQLVTLASFALIPVSIGFAVLRYRLYDIDRIISRTASYAVVTALVVSVYVGVVALVSRLLPHSSNLAVAAATLAAAAVFRPAHGWTQTRVDRRFDRSRYDAQRTVDDFGSRLRNEVDLSTVTGDLLGAVSACLAPSSITLWFKGAP